MYYKNLFKKMQIKVNNRKPKIGEVIYKQTGEVIDDVFDIKAISPQDKKEKLTLSNTKTIKAFR